MIKTHNPRLASIPPPSSFILLSLTSPTRQRLLLPRPKALATHHQEAQLLLQALLVEARGVAHPGYLCKCVGVLWVCCGCGWECGWEGGGRECVCVLEGRVCVLWWGEGKVWVWVGVGDERTATCASGRVVVVLSCPHFLFLSCPTD